MPRNWHSKKALPNVFLCQKYHLKRDSPYTATYSTEPIRSQLDLAQKKTQQSNQKQPIEHEKECLAYHCWIRIFRQMSTTANSKRNAVKLNKESSSWVLMVCNNQRAKETTKKIKCVRFQLKSKRRGSQSKTAIPASRNEPMIPKSWPLKIASSGAPLCQNVPTMGVRKSGIK